MSVPPPPDPWGSQPPIGGQPGGVPPWGPPPQMPAGQPGGMPPWGAQQPWSAPPGPPPRGGRGKWVWAAIALLGVIVVTVVITVLVVRPDSRNDSPTPGNGSAVEIASADDKGPVNIITEDPTCEAWGRIGREYSSQAKAANWGDRDKSVPASAWTPEQRTMYETVAEAMRSAADQTVNLVKSTPHRVMRELYEQLIAYARKFADSVPNYTPTDNYSAGLTDTITSGLSAICSAIQYHSAEAIAPLVPEVAPPSEVSPSGGGEDPQPFLTTSDQVCSEWGLIVSKFNADLADWQAVDPAIPASEWTPEQHAVNDGVAPVMVAAADNFETLGRRSENPTLQDFAVLMAQYLRGYVKALPTYTAADNYLISAANYIGATVNAACEAVRG